jgi:hypothetical protein
VKKISAKVVGAVVGLVVAVLIGFFVLVSVLGTFNAHSDVIQNVSPTPTPTQSLLP